MCNSKQSILDIIQSREARVLRQNQLINQYQKTLISYKLNIPGDIKDSHLYRKIFKEGLEELVLGLQKFNMDIIFEDEVYKASGPEAYIVVDEEVFRVKKVTTEIEEEHPLGRIFDFDVLDKNGAQASRTQIGRESRKCFICDKDAFKCGRSRSHSLEELIMSINKRAKIYFENKK